LQLLWTLLTDSLRYFAMSIVYWNCVPCCIVLGSSIVTCVNLSILSHWDYWWPYCIAAVLQDKEIAVLLYIQKLIASQKMENIQVLKIVLRFCFIFSFCFMPIFVRFLWIIFLFSLGAVSFMQEILGTRKELKTSWIILCKCCCIIFLSFNLAISTFYTPVLCPEPYL
jgi:hypothetical protein